LSFDGIGHSAAPWELPIAMETSVAWAVKDQILCSTMK